MPPQTQITLAGVVRSVDGKALAEMTVNAYHQREDDVTPLGQAVTGAEGHFSMNVTLPPAAEAGTLRFRIFDAKDRLFTIAERKGPRRQEDNLWDVQLTAGPVKDEPGDDDTPRQAPARYSVLGRVLDPNGPPIAKAAVQAFHRTLRDRVLLGEGQTDANGFYTIRYTPPKGVRHVDLLVRATHPNDDDTAATSDLICKAPRHQMLDLVLGGETYRGYSEFERLTKTLQPHLDGLPPADLQPDDAELLACKTDVEEQHITYLIVAARHVEKVGIPPAAFYGFLRMGLPTELSLLLSRSSRAHRQALEDALAANLIPARLEVAVPNIITKLQQATVQLALAVRDGDADTSLSGLLTTAGLPDAQQNGLLLHYTRHEGPVEAFWADVRDNPDIDDKQIDNLQFTLQLGTLTGGYVPLVETLQAEKQSGRFAAVEDLAALDATDWAEMLEASGVPDFVPGETKADRLQSYTHTLTGLLEQAFSTRSVAAKIKKTADADDKDLVRFFENSPDFEFTMHIDRFLREHADTALDGIDDPQALTHQLKGLQRVYKLAPEIGRYEAMDELLQAGVDSACKIVTMGKETFLNDFGPVLNGSAETVFSNAQQTAASALTLFGKYGPALNRALPYVMNGTGGDGAADVPIPDLETLFGSLDFCACEHCRSVYSPAAYLADVLQFLKQQSAIEIQPDGTVVYPGETALDELFKRRPDIGDIELSCHNTNTELPYVDLLLEVLESGVVTGQTAVYQTTWTADELSANTEHFNEEAYDDDHLAGAVYPWNLPFNLWLSEARTYLGHLGVSLDELMEVFAPESADVQIAIERLGLSPTQAHLITRTLTPMPPLRASWGINPTALDDVPTFLEQADLEYDDLTELLAATFINPDGKLAIQSAAPCTTEGATIQNLTKEALGRIHRFVRLQRALGWTIRELDEALAVLDVAGLTIPFLVHLSHIRRLRDDLNTPLVEMLSWWSTISTRVDEQDGEDRSLYEQLFLNNAVLSPVDTAFELNADRTDLADRSERIGDHAPVIVAALEISEDELLDLLVHEGLDEDDDLNLDHLSRLYRNASLADALDLSIAELLSVRSLSGIDPFADTQATLDVAAKAGRIDDSGFDVKELDYLLRHAYQETDGVAPTESTITSALDGIRDGLATIAAEHVFTSDPTGEITRSTLALVLEAKHLETAIALIDGTTADSEADQEAFIDEQLALFLDPADAKAKLVGSNALEGGQERYEYVLEPLLAYLRTTLSEQFITQELADALDLDAAIAEALLADHVTVPGAPATTALDALLALDPDAEEYTDEILNTYRLLDKIATVLTTLGTTAEDLPWVFETGPSLGWLDLTALPLEPITGTAPDTFEGWERLVRLYVFHDRYTTGDTTVFDVLGLAHAGAAQPEIADALTALTGWDRVDLDFLTGPDGFDFTHPDAYQDEQYLVRLDEAVALLKRLGMSAEAVVGWQVTDDLADMEATARAVKSAVKAKYDNDAWLAVAAPLKDALREQQRAALVAYLVATESLAETSADLHARFLIDVEMDPCMTTSRIKQALSSVQLFVQRCLLNLENVELSEAAAEQWEWMKNYRVWEANRKIFLYPENWIEPDLRDDKSPFFLELENELLQNELTEEAAETALVNYLEKLDDVANMEVCAVYHQEEGTGDDTIDVVHVVARTYGIPHVYYYRQYVDATYWTAWERIDAGIEGDHLLAVVWNRRLHLIWPLFTKVVHQDTGGTVSAQPLEPGSLGRMIVDALEAAYPDPSVLYDDEQDFLDRWVDVGGWDLIYDLEGTDFDLEEIATLGYGWFGGPEDVEGTLEAIYGVDLGGVVFDTTEEWLSPTATTSGSEGDDWEIQLAWSVLRAEGWSPKTVSEEALTVPARSQTAFCFKPEVGGSGGLTLGDWTQPLDDWISPIGRVAQPAERTVLGSDADQLVISCYWDGVTTFTSDGERIGRSFRYDGQFVFTGCGGQVLVTVSEDNSPNPEASWPLPPATATTDMRFREAIAADHPLEMPTGEVDGAGAFDLDDEVVQLPVLNKTPGRFSVAVPHQYFSFVSQDVFFYQDETRALFVVPGQTPVYQIPFEGLQDARAVTFDAPHFVKQTYISISNDPIVLTEVERDDETMVGPALDLSESERLSILYSTTYRFKPFHHPYACRFIKDLNRYGIDGLMQRSVQMLSGTYFESDYDPVETAVQAPYPTDDVAFSYGGAYVPYNWELFFHAPLLIADRLSQNQKFEDAQRWFHYIFDPTARVDGAGVTGPERYWMFYPFYQETTQETLYDLMLALNAGDPDLEHQVEQWRENPFKPHLIARLRPSAYMKTVVMKYIDNLIAWGDQLFRRDTIESINEATQLYLLAADILGPYPETLPAEDVGDDETYNTLADQLDTFSNALVELENLVATPSGSTGGNGAPLPDVGLLYFCIPNNQELLERWDTVADRLFKIRHCMNIEGVERSLALFEPPIDPALLVKAAASGVDLGSVLSDLHAPLPHYRFSFMVQKAVEFCGDVRALGAALLSALEKQDAEELALLRSGQETGLLQAIRQIKEQQIEEAETMLDALREGEKIAGQRHDYYAGLVDEGLDMGEKTQRDLLDEGRTLQVLSGFSYLLGAAVTPIPRVEAEAGFPPALTTEVVDGAKLAKVLQIGGQALSIRADEASTGSTMAGLLAGFKRREQEWVHQRDLVEQELEQIAQQIAAAEIRVELTQQELANHDKQIENAEAVYDFMTDKYTNGELYGWMVSQLSSIYFQSYQLAYDLSQQAQKAYEYELGIEGADFVQFGYWDSLKKGLLSGEQLHHDLRRMEAAYLDQNKREYELTKHVSLAMLDPVALLTLKETGTCYITLPEALFDLDYSGHYMRRIKSVSLTIPAVTGPYTSVNATLTLLGSSVRFGSDPAGNEGHYARDASGDDPRFSDSYGAIQSIATSDGRGDSGLFELTFRDERYLPFEGAGVISQWQLELPTTLRSFDYDTISDVILHVHYTARDGGSTLKTAANDALQAAINAMPLGENGDERAGLFQAFSARRDFPSEWHRFLHSAETDGTQTLALNLDPERFPYFVSEQDMTIEAAHLFLKPKTYDPANDYALAFSLAGADGTHAGTLDVGGSLVDGLPYSEPLQGSTDGPGAWTLTAEADGSAAALRDADGLLDAAAVEDLILVCAYSISD